MLEYLLRQNKGGLKVNYEYIKNYQDNDERMEVYFKFTQEVFGFDLKEWRDKGFWKNQYVPHSLVYNNQVIANASAAIMKLQIKGKEVDAVQLGSVGVLPEYRGKGLSRILIEKVLEEYKNYPLIFLFSGQENYYQKYGFKRFDVNIPLIHLSSNDKNVEPINLTLESEPVKRLINGNLQRSAIFDAKGNSTFNWFHLMYIHSENIYYIKEKDVVFLAEYDEDSVDVFDILSESKVDFEEIKEYILKPNTKVVRFHFTPDWLNISYETISDDEDSMYILGSFPTDMTNFKLPIIVQT